VELGDENTATPGSDPERATIVALATGPVQAALATIRMSGPRVHEILARVLRRPGSALSLSLEARRATVAHFMDPADGETIDEIVVTFFPGPRSYTGEDLAELSLHGGPWLVAEANRVLTTLGATQARPGEFTRRALLAGKLDLARAEAVQALVTAQSGAAAKLAARHLAGELSERYQRIRHGLVSIAACLEGPLEFPEDTSGEENESAIAALKGLSEVRQCLEGLVRSQAQARRIVSGISIPIVGRPNVGKSSIFNGLLGSSRAIVSPHPGTTRDSIEASMLVGGRLVRLIDTAGLGVAIDDLDAEAMSRAEGHIEDADIVVLVLDRSADLQESDRELLSRLAGRQVVVVLNKTDLEPRFISTDLVELGIAAPPVLVSVKDGSGLPALIDRLTIAVETGAPGDDPLGVVSSARQQGLLVRALGDLGRVAHNIESDRAELAIEDLRLAELSLREILGEASPDEVLDEVFQTFCIGK
jgi:tRNA modification GTPase